MIGSIIGAGLKVGAGIFGGIKASQAMREVKRNLQKQMQENQDWYDRRYNEDATQRADAQRLLTMTADSIRQRNEQAAGAQAVMGGTEESVAAARAANNQALTDTMSNIASTADQRKAQIENQYMSTKADINNKLNALSQEKAKAISAAVSGVANAAGGAMGA